MGPNLSPEPLDPEPADEAPPTDLPSEADFEAAGLGAGEGENEGEGDAGGLTQEAEADTPPSPEVDVEPGIAPEVDADPTVLPEVGAEQPAPGAAGAAAVRKRAAKKVAKPRRPLAPEPPKLVLAPEQRAEARQRAFERLRSKSTRSREQLEYVLEALEAGRSIVFLARFRRPQTAGLDERSLRALRAEWQRLREEEEHRVGIRELVRQHGALTPEREQALLAARSTYAMDDVAAPYMPVMASRAFVARGMGLEPLAEAVRDAAPGSELSALAQPFVKVGGEPASLDVALGGARDILAEEFCLDGRLRSALRELFAFEGHLLVSVRPEKKGDAGRHAAVLGNLGPAMRVPALRFLAVRRGERERVLAAVVEPHEERALAVLHAHACPEGHPHAGLLRAAAEDGYRRILKPLMQREIREELKLRADQHALETFERTLRNLLLGPVGGPKKTLGIRPDVVQGHRWCAVDATGLPAGSGQLPHEPTSGRAAVLAELKGVLKTYEIEAVAVGSTGGKAEALSLVREALAGRERDVAVLAIHDGGVRAVEALGKLATDDRPDVPSEQRGALTLARRFQDPLAELLTIDPKALALGPHVGDVHQGELRRLLDETITSCVCFAGVDATRAGAEVIARLPGFDRSKAEAFVRARSEGGPLASKAALAAWEGVGPEAAEQAVGFLRLPGAPDLRDRTQLHPEQYAIVDAMAQQLGLEVQAFCADPANFEKLTFDELVTPETPKPLLFDVCWQLAEGTRDPRPRFAVPIPPPPGITLQTLRPGLVLEGRVTRVAPFGVFVDVGLEVEGLLPVPHIGDRPGVDPATVAPLGAVIQVRVLEVFPDKRRLALTMRSDARLEPRMERGGERGGDRGGERGGDRGPRGPRGPRRPMGAGAPGGEPVLAGAPAGGPPPEAGRRDRGERRGRDDRAGGDSKRGGGGRAPEGRGAGRPRQFSAAGGGGGGESREARPPRKAGGGTNAIGGAFGGRDAAKDLGLFDRGIKDEAGTPKRISLKAEGPASLDDEKGLTPEQMLAKKLADLLAGKFSTRK